MQIGSLTPCLTRPNVRRPFFRRRPSSKVPFLKGYNRARAVVGHVANADFVKPHESATPCVLELSDKS
eukprot:6184659-Pleurochrysis_carterae.AAC.2